MLSVSLMMRNSAVFLKLPSLASGLSYILSPSVSSSSSSYMVISRSSAISKGARRAPQLILILLAVLPAANLYFLYCRTAKWLGLSFSSSLNAISTGFSKVSSSSRTSIALTSSISVAKFCSSSGAS